MVDESAYGVSEEEISSTTLQRKVDRTFFFSLLDLDNSCLIGGGPRNESGHHSNFNHLFQSLYRAISHGQAHRRLVTSLEIEYEDTVVLTRPRSRGRSFMRSGIRLG